MGNRILVMLMGVERKDITLPIVDWMQGDVGNLLDNACDNKPESGLFMLSGRGHHLYDICIVRDRCGLKSLNFLDDECTTLQGTDLIPAIRSLTIIIDELLSAVDELSCMYIGHINDPKSMQIAFHESIIYHDVNLDDEGKRGLFLLVKSILVVMTDALAKNKLFLYINYLIS